MKGENSKLNVLLSEFRQKNPTREYRIAPRGENVQRKLARWTSVCKHDRVVCKDCGGKAFCEHNKKRQQCKECGTKSLCKHKKQKHHCRECGNKSRCLHGRVKSACIDCKSKSICEHKKIRSKCRKCKGGSLCEHLKRRHTCIECNGSSICEHKKMQNACIECKGSWVCSHNKLKRNCAKCNGHNVCPICLIRLKIRDGVCTRCHPTFIPLTKGTSKIACSFFDMLEKELNVSIQHIHYNTCTNSITGEEHCPIEWPKKKIDGFYNNPDGTKFAFEFLGDYFHGHPTLWEKNPNAINHFGHVHKNDFDDTEKKLQKLLDIGYWVVYIWESEFKKKPTFVSLHSICRTFNGKLEY